MTTIYVTHDQIEAMTMGDRVAVMRKGILLQVDAPQVLYDNPDNLFVAGFIGSPPMNMAARHHPRGRRHAAGPARRASGSGSTRSSWRPSPALRAYIGRDVALGVRSEDLSEPGPRNDVPEDQRLHVDGAS